MAFLSLAFMQNRDSSSLHVEQHDGPYVSYRNGLIYISTVQNDHGKFSLRTDSMPEANKSGITISVPTDTPGETFSFPLKKSIEPEKSEYKKVSRQFVISDIEANFAALRKLLVAGGVIDQKFNWTFGDGHLVLTGDFVDRGDRQTEVLWLIYSLEEKARAAGGYVHYVLGNHEIMNLSGDVRYLHPKYAEVTALMGTHYMSLLDSTTELGRWLRSKNIMERVGNMLYVHGGVSADINLLELKTAEINDLSRPYYSDTTYKYADPRVGIIYYDNGPFWYRGYYGGAAKASMNQVDSTLLHHRVQHVITGHTIVSDTITTWFDGKIINVDVVHAKGNSEALLIQKGKFTRVTPEGKQIPISLN